MNTVETTSVSPHSSNALLGVVHFSRELFIETIEELEKQYRHDQKCHEAFRVILPNDYVSNYDNHWLQNALVKLLQKAMNDEHKDSWIEYFMWEIDFGKKYYEGCVRDANAEPVDISTAAALWDFLNNA